MDGKREPDNHRTPQLASLRTTWRGKCLRSGVENAWLTFTPAHMAERSVRRRAGGWKHPSRTAGKDRSAPRAHARQPQCVGVHVRSAAFGVTDQHDLKWCVHLFRQHLHGMETRNTRFGFNARGLFSIGIVGPSQLSDIFDDPCIKLVPTAQRFQHAHGGR